MSVGTVCSLELVDLMEKHGNGVFNHQLNFHEIWVQFKEKI